MSGQAVLARVAVTATVVYRTVKLPPAASMAALFATARAPRPRPKPSASS